MSPRVGGEPPRYRPEDARRILDSATPELRELMRRELASGDSSSDGFGGSDARFDALTDRVDALVEALDLDRRERQHLADRPPEGSAEAQARGLATALAQAQSTWYSTGGTDGA